MNYELEVGKSNPAVFNPLNGGLPPLVAGSGSSTKLTASVDTTFIAFNKGYEFSAFTLEVWFLPISNTGEHVVIGHASEGVLWDGSKFILRIKQGDGSVTNEASWTPSEIKSFHVVMVYISGQVLLYIDSKIVAMLQLTTESFFVSGQQIRVNVGTSTAIYDSLALYYRALSREEIRNHYAWGTSVPKATQIAMTKGGTTWSMSYQDVRKAESFLFDANNFDGYVNNVGFTSGKLISGSSDGGTWQQSIALSSLVGTTCPGIHVTYEGEATTFSYSLDGSTWTVSPNKRTILEGTTLPANSMLFVKLQLTGLDAWVSSLRLDVLESRTLMPASGNRTLTFTKTAMDQTPGSQLEYQADRGADIIPNGQLVIPFDVDSATFGTIEVWAKRKSNSSGFASIFDMQTTGGAGGPWCGYNGSTWDLGGSGTFINGQPQGGGGTMDLGVWYHIVSTFTPTNYRVALGVGRSLSNGYADITIGHVALYPQQMTASQAQSLYRANIGAPVMRVDDTSGVTMTDPAPAVKIYAYSWSYVSGSR